MKEYEMEQLHRLLDAMIEGDDIKVDIIRSVYFGRYYERVK